MMMNGKKKLVLITIVVGLIVSLSSVSFAMTVFFEPTPGGVISDIAAIQFEILEPLDADLTAAGFEPYFPSGWFDFSGGKLVSAFDGAGGNSLQPGVLAIFDMDVLLGGWELTTQDGEIVPMGFDLGGYEVLVRGTDYVISDVPIPPALLLFGSGIIGMLGLRRKFNK